MKNKEVEVIADLDAMLAQPVAFTLLGKRHIIEPITTQQALVFSNEYVSFQDLMNKDSKLTPDEIIDGYLRLVSSVVPSIAKSDIENAAESQLQALFVLIIETFTGKIFAEKKTLNFREIQPSTSNSMQ